MDEDKTYYAMNKQKQKEYRKKWAEKNKERIREVSKKWRQANAETIKQKKAYYYKTGAYNNKLIQKFNVMKGEILVGNNGSELINNFKELVNEMHERDILDDEEYNNIISLF